MDVLVANMEYHSQDYAAFIQQNGLPDTDKPLVRFVERNIMQLQSDKMQKLFAHPTIRTGASRRINLSVAFLSSLHGQQRILDWDALL
jgi:hypothetical protein